MKVFINVETEGKNNEELTAELVMVKSFAVKKITDLFPSVKADKDIEFVSPLSISGRENDCKHIHLEDHARLLLTLADCDVLIDAPQTGYGRRRIGSCAIANAARDYGIPVVELGLNDYNDPSKGMFVNVADYYSLPKRRSIRQNVTYSRYNQGQDNYEEEE
jgi:hypothetical protein